MSERSSGDCEVRAQLLEHLQRARVAGIPEEWFRSVSPAAAQTVEPSADATLPPASPAAETRWNSLSEVEQDALVCRRCRLCETRTKVVFGVGNTNAPLVAFVGEGPGADEDRAGEPFVGKAGQLLTAAITKGMGLTRDAVYICNVVKCRPPENRTPLPDEMEACLPYLYQQLEFIRPKVIITLGQPAQLALVGSKIGITRLRGNWQEWRGIRVMPTFHPAYLLRNPPAKKEFWTDLQAVMAEVGLSRPSSPQS